MIRLIYMCFTLVQFGWSNLKRSRLTTWVATSIIVAVLWLLAGWYQAQTGINQWLRPYQSSLLISVYLDPAQTPGRIANIETRLKRSDQVRSFRYLSAKAARAEFIQMFPELKDVLGSIKHNPLPPMYEIHLDPNTARPDKIRNLVQTLESIPGVLSVEYQQWWINKLMGILRIVKWGGIILGLILAAMALFTVANVIRLSFYARKDEVQILSLLGAHPILIQIPFYLEGLFLGFFGGIITTGIWYVTIKLLEIYLNRLIGQITLSGIHFAINPSLMALLIGCGAILGLIGSIIALWMLHFEEM